MFPYSRRACSLAAVGGLLAMLGNTGRTAEEETPAYHLIEVGFGTVTAPDITEDATFGGTTTEYEWQGGRDTGYQAQITYLRILPRTWGGLAWGGDVAISGTDITPASYTVAGGSYRNGSTASLEYRTLGVNAVGGYTWGFDANDGFHGAIAILPVLGVGLGWVESESFDGLGYERNKGAGLYWQAGLRLGLYLTERKWHFGVVGSYVYGSAEIEVDFAGGASSTLEIERNGVGIGIAGGHRF